MQLPYDPGSAQLRRYLPVLAMIAAPYAGLGGDHDPVTAIDHAAEWRALVDMLAEISARQTDAAVPLALARLMPPTAETLGAALAAGNSLDGFRVVHIVAAGDRDMLTLEDENGWESYAVAEQVIRLFRQGSARVVVLDGAFSQRLAQMLVERKMPGDAKSPVEAVVGTRRRVAPGVMMAFNVAFYGALSSGSGVRAAFRAGLAEVERQPEGPTDRFEIVTAEPEREVMLPMPAPGTRAPRPLVADGLPPLIGVPQSAGFVGQREVLSVLAQDVPHDGPGRYVLHGPVGMGKTRLAAEFAARFGWRFPAGVRWLTVNAQTSAREVIAAAASLAGLSAHAPVKDVVAALGDRRGLLILDGADALDPAQARTLAGWLAAIDPARGAWLLLTGRVLGDARATWGDHRAMRVGRCSPKTARTLAMRLAVERGLDALDVDTIDEFLEASLNIPRLILRGLEIVEAESLQTALKWLDGFDGRQDDPIAARLADRLQWLGVESANRGRDDDPLLLLRRVQGLPDVFDTRLARGLVGDKSVQHVARLQRAGALTVEGRAVRIEAAARQFVAARWPLSGDQQAATDRYLASYLVKTWPAAASTTANGSEGGTSEPLSAAGRAWLNNARAILGRQASGATVGVVLLGELLAVAWPSFRAAGLAEEFLGCAEPVRDGLNDGPTLGRLLVAMGEAAGDLGREADAGWLFNRALTLDAGDSGSLAAAGRAYGRHLAKVGDPADAARTLSDTLQRLLARRQSDDVPHYAMLTHEWANVLMAMGRPADAVKRTQAALAGYTEIRRADLAVQAQVDLALALMAAGETERAEDGLRRALMSADSLRMRSLAGRIRQLVARLSLEAGEPLEAESLLSDALADCLPGGDESMLAGLWRDLGQVQARLGQVDEAAASMARAAAGFERAGDQAGHASALAALGQVQIARGDAVAAQQTLHRAIDLARTLGDQALAARAASVLVRVHQLRARHAGHDPAARQESRRRAEESQVLLAAAGLGDHAVALREVIAGLGG